MFHMKPQKVNSMESNLIMLHGAWTMTMSTFDHQEFLRKQVLASDPILSVMVERALSMGYAPILMFEDIKK